MISFPSRRSLQFPLLFLISLQILSGLADDDPSGGKNENKDASLGASRSNMGLKITLICLGVVTVIGFCVFLYKLWQKKKKRRAACPSFEAV